MNADASKYLAVETTSSAICNGILNFAFAFLLFHKRPLTPATGPDSLLLDSIGATFFIVSLSVLIPSLIARHRRRAGTLPVRDDAPSAKTRNIYLWSIVAGLLLTAVCFPFNAFLLPKLFPNGVTFHNVLLFKTVYGIVLGSLATFMALRRALTEVG